VPGGPRAKDRQKGDIDSLERKVKDLEERVDFILSLLGVNHGAVAEAVVKDGTLLGVVEMAGPNGLIFRPAVDVKLSDEAKEYLQGALNGIRDYQRESSGSATADIVLTERSGGWLDAITFSGLRSQLEFERAKLAAKVAVELSLPRGGRRGGSR
jgi:hypothetical protein